MIEYHADDYGLFPEQSKRILKCITSGRCNGISIMPNSPYLDECMKMLDPSISIRKAVHINLVEGKSISPREKTGSITDAEGRFVLTFENVLLRSFFFGRKRLKEQIRNEIRMQIRQSLQYIPEDDIRIDSHTHIHMVPLVFDALIDALRMEKVMPVSIRIPCEQKQIYKGHRNEIEDKSWINRIKVLVLNFFAVRNLRKYRNSEFVCLQNPAVFFGVSCSGRMTRHNTDAVVDDLKTLAEKKSVDLELLFHPGAVYETEDIQKLTSEADRTFLTDKRRDLEAKALEY